MEKKILKNINRAEVLRLKDQVNYQEGQVVSKTLVQNKYVSLTLFAFDENEEISTHESQGDAIVIVLEGTALITIAGVKYDVSEGETIVMPAKVPHAVFGKTKMKFMLTVAFEV